MFLETDAIEPSLKHLTLDRKYQFCLFFSTNILQLGSTISYLSNYTRLKLAIAIFHGKNVFLSIQKLYFFPFFLKNNTKATFFFNKVSLMYLDMVL